MKTSGLCVAVVLLAVLAFSASSASAAEPWWHLNSGSAPANLPPEGKGEIIVTATNLGDANMNGAATPIDIADTLPEHLQAVGIAGAVVRPGGAPPSPIACSPASLSCSFTEALPPYSQIQVRISVEVGPGASSSEVNRASVSGGGALGASVARAIAVSSAPTAFGVEDYEMTPEEEGGAPDTQAGSHPFQLTTTLDLNQSSEPSKPPALTKDLHFNTPPGLVGNPTVFPQCTEADFLYAREETDECPNDTAIGVAAITVIIPTVSANPFPFVVPVFNLPPEVGEPARFGFYFHGIPVFLDTSVLTGEGYAVRVSVTNITQSTTFISSRVTFWGVPGAASHDNSRGWGCISEEAYYHSDPEHVQACAPPSGAATPPFLALPTSCTGPLQTTVEADSWKERGVFTSFPTSEPLPALDGCDRLPFKPEVKVSPDVQEASKPSGLKVDVHVPQSVDTDAEGLSASDVNDIVVTLPEGLILNPSAADGLTACPLLTGREAGKEAQEGKGEVAGIDLETPQPANCPNASKIATVTIHSPLLPKPLEGFVYLAAPQNFSTLRGFPQENPFSKHVAQYLVAEDKEAGVLVKLPGSVELGGEPGVTGLQPGQIRSTFANNPQLPFEDAELHFFGGERAPLATPSHCGAYTTNASYAPWSGNEAVGAQGSFAITSGPGGGACPSNPLPFKPTLTGGATNVNAGAFSPFTATMSRLSGEQNLQSLEVHLPPGLSGILAGVELCPEAQANAGTCGPNSLIGETTVSVGVGGEPYTNIGKFYLTGPYNGTGSCTVAGAGTQSSNGCAPFGISFVVPAKAGPFDLQEGRPVIVRAKIEINPITAAITITSNPPGTPGAIPTMIEGFPLEIEHVNATTTRSGFQFNPTSCNKMEVSGTIHSSEGSTNTIGVPFQVTNCKNLAFTPKFTASTSAKDNFNNLGASLTTKVTYPDGPQGTYANVAKVKVELPLALPSRLTTLQKACLAKVFEANPANCPPDSFIGHAIVHTQLLPVPLEGPAIFVSHGGEAFPSLIMVLQGYGVTIDLVGTTYISHAGITSTTFKTVPDQPFETFELTLPTGKFSALAADTNVCKPTKTETVKKKVSVKRKGKTIKVTKKVSEKVAAPLLMPTEFVAQNGAEFKQTTKISVTGCKAAKPATKKHKKAKGKRKKK